MPISSYYNSPTRLSGISSGLDTESIVSQLVKLEQMKIDRVYQNKTTSQWKLDAYNDVNKQLSDFRSKYLSILSPDNIFSAGAYKAYTANYTSNNFFKVGASGSLIPNNYTVSKTVMAKYAHVQGTAGNAKAAELVSATNAAALKSNATGSVMMVAGGGTADGTTQLKDLVDSSDNPVFNFEGGQGTISINGTSVNFDENMTVDDFVSAINAKTATTKITAEFTTGGQFKLFSTNSGAQMSVRNVLGKAFGSSSATGIGIQEGTLPRVAFTESTKLSDLKDVLGFDVLDGSGNLSFKINNETYTFDGNQTIQDILDEVNADAATNHAKISFDASTMKFAIRSDATTGVTTDNQVEVSNLSGSMFGSKSVTGIAVGKSTTSSSVLLTDTLKDVARKMGSEFKLDADGKFKFEINGKEFSFTGDTKLSDVMSAVNNSNVGVNMAFSDISKSFTFTSKVMGRDATIDLKNVGTSNAFADGTNATGIFMINAGTVQGTNSSITINGEVVEGTSNNISVDGMNFTITGDFEEADPAKQYNIGFTQDVDSVITKVKAFITDYNKMVNGFYSMLTEDKNRKFTPLTEEQKSAMSDKEIEQWEAKAKAGILRSDPTLRGLIGDLRSGLWATVGETGESPFSIGFTTASRTMSGELQLDETAFRQALQSDPDKVSRIMTDLSYSTDKLERFNNSGFVARISNSIGDYTTDTRNGVIKTQTQAVKDYDKKIEDLTIKMYQKQERYWAQFTALEKAMSAMNSQSAWLQSQLSGLNGSQS